MQSCVAGSRRPAAEGPRTVGSQPRSQPVGGKGTSHLWWWKVPGADAQKFKAKFEECRNEVDKRAKKAGKEKNDSADKVAEKLEELSVKEESKNSEKKEETREKTEGKQ
nr:ran-specific GTPase-activating protein-like [Pelodiscus sinensis]|eukprot:XP_025045759.1 ran-specific GTPase-activating protein-like [Pelodiscus sinensis]